MATRKAAKKAQKARPKAAKSSKKREVAASKSAGNKKASKNVGPAAGSGKSAQAGKASKKTAKKATSKAPASRKRPTVFASAVKVYEAGLKLMHSEKFDRAKAKLEELISQYATETELLDRAHVLVQACEKRISEKRDKAPKLKTADEYYEVGVAELNRHKFDSAREHLESAMKLSPKADHVHYALAAASALDGERDAALESLRKAIQYRDVNRFQAANDSDFESLSEDSEFIQLVTSDEN
jgi:tetratricopeptide (TPR) repeat protein